MAFMNKEIEIWQGDDMILDFNIQKISKQVKDVTQCNFEFAMIISKTGILTKSTIDGGIVIFETSHARVILNAQDSVDKLGVYQYELRLINPEDNSSQIVAVGSIKINKSYTR